MEKYRELAGILSKSSGYQALKDAGFVYTTDQGDWVEGTLVSIPGKDGEGFCQLPNGKDGYRDSWGGIWEKGD